MPMIEVQAMIPVDRTTPAHGVEALIRAVNAYLAAHIGELDAPYWHTLRRAYTTQVTHAGSADPAFAGMPAAAQFVRDCGFVAKPTLSGVLLTACPGAAPATEGAERLLEALRDLLAPGARVLIVESGSCTATSYLLDGDRQILVSQGEIVWRQESVR